MQVGERLTFGGAVDELPRVIAQRVMNTDNLVLADGHVSSNVAGTHRGRGCQTHSAHRAGAKDTIAHRPQPWQRTAGANSKGTV